MCLVMMQASQCCHVLPLQNGKTGVSRKSYWKPCLEDQRHARACVGQPWDTFTSLVTHVYLGPVVEPSKLCYSGSSSGCSEFPRIATNTLLAQTLASSRTRRMGHARAFKVVLCGASVCFCFTYSHVMDIDRA